MSQVQAGHHGRRGLFDWIKHEVTLTTTGVIYGPGNPFRDPLVEQSYWYVMSGIHILLLGYRLTSLGNSKLE